jgi:multidrug transporter EmrE-like cation transporter
MRILLLVTAALLFAVGGLFMKYSDGMTKLAPGMAVLALFCGGATCQGIAMKRAQMGVVYVFVLGLEAAVAFLLSAAVLGERVTAGKICALILILGGIVLLERA